MTTHDSVTSNEIDAAEAFSDNEIASSIEGHARLETLAITKDGVGFGVVATHIPICAVTAETR